MLADVSSNPLLRTYITLKSEFKIEPFLCKIENPKHRVAFAKLRASSHCLEIERGRHSKPKTPINSRVCHFCKIIEDEPHVLITCPAYHDERQILMSHVSSLYPRVLEMNEHEAFIFLSLTRMQTFYHGPGNLYIMLSSREVCYKPIRLGQLSPYRQWWRGLTRRSPRFLLREVWQMQMWIFTCEFVGFDTTREYMCLDIARIYLIRYYAYMFFSCVYAHLRMFMYV